MRIIGNIDHPIWKITVFKTGEKISLQMEYGPLVQHYKFQDGEGIENTSDVESWLSLERRRKVQSIFVEMAEVKSRSSDLDDQLDLPNII